MRSINKDLQIVRDKLDRDVAAFLARGNTIKQLESTESAEVPVGMRERDNASWQRCVTEDKQRLADYHARGEMLHIKFMPKCKRSDERFRYCFNAKVMGHFPALDEAMAFKVKA